VPGRGSIFAVTLPQATPASKPATDEAPDAAAHPAPARLLLLPPETQALRDAAMLASNWGFNSEWAESFDEAQQKARREGMVLVGMAAAYPAGTLKNVSDATAALVLLDCISPLGSAHVLPLPLRPAKLRALLTQLLTVAASPPSPVSSEAG
jgi:hypothetical protein